MQTSPQLTYRASRPEEWRAFPADKQNKVCSHKSIANLGEFIPLYTNGLIAEVRRLGTEVIELLQLSNIVWPKDSEFKIGHGQQAPKVRKKKTLSVDDLL